jgi:putative tricarboxylic transport membrane protein
VPVIAILTLVGSYAIRNNFLDVILMIIFGVIGFAIRRLGFTGPPIVLGLVLGPLMETGFVQAYLKGQAYAHPWFALFDSPLSWVLISMCLVSFLWPYFGPIKARLKGNSGGRSKQQPRQ